MVSHELRAPLTSIKGSASTVLGSPSDMDPAVIRQFFRIIEDQADHMHALVGDLLDIAHIETGMLPVNPEPAEVAVLLDQARNAFSRAGGRNPLAIDIEPDLPLVLADRRRVVQVLVNLLTNAARHSPAASVIGLKAAKSDVHVAVSVTDEGRGIQAESLPRLFRKFSRVQAEEQGGDTGLGLAICKGIVEAHGGRIWPRATALGWAPASPSPCPPWTPPPAGAGAYACPSRYGRGGASRRTWRTGCGCWRWTTTPTTSGTCGTP